MIVFFFALEKKFSEYFICLDSSKSTYFVTDTISQLKNYACSNDKPLWFWYHVVLEESFDKIDSNSERLNLIIKNQEEELEINISKFINGGEITNIILEQDTAYWFNQKDNPIRPLFPDFETPALSRRLGCQDNFCFASISIQEEELCFDD